MEGSSSKHFQDQNMGLGFQPLNGDQSLYVSTFMNADVLSQEVQNLALNEWMNGKGKGVAVDSKDYCHFFMTYGFCKFGSNCRYNHPVVDGTSQVVKEITKLNEENLNRTGQVECKYYLTPEGCKHGKACRYNHSGRKTVGAPALEFNFLGLPIRPGEKECPYFWRSGSCKYGMNCWFDHSPPPSMGGGFPLYGYNGLEDTMPCWSFAVPVNEMAPFGPHIYQPAQCAPHSEWMGYQVPLEHHEAPIYTTSGSSQSYNAVTPLRKEAPIYTTPGKSQFTPPAISMNNAASDVKSSPQQQQKVLVKEESAKPNVQREHSFKYGFGSQHPRAPSCPLNDKGLPLRPDFEVCAYYGRYGVCKHGPACKFDHPPTPVESVPAAGSEEAQLAQLPDPTTEELSGPTTDEPQLAQLPDPTTEELSGPTTDEAQLAQLPDPTTEELPGPTTEELPGPTTEATEELPGPTTEDKN